MEKFQSLATVLVHRYTLYVSVPPLTDLGGCCSICRHFPGCCLRWHECESILQPSLAFRRRFFFLLLSWQRHEFKGWMLAGNVGLAVCLFRFSFVDLQILSMCGVKDPMSQEIQVLSTGDTRSQAGLCIYMCGSLALGAWGTDQEQPRGRSETWWSWLFPRVEKVKRIHGSDCCCSWMVCCVLKANCLSPVSLSYILSLIFCYQVVLPARYSCLSHLGSSPECLAWFLSILITKCF